MARSAVVLCIAVFLAVFDLGSALKCYQCDSQSNPNCKNKLNASMLVDCASQSVIQYNQQSLYNLLPADAFGGLAGVSKYCYKLTTNTGTLVRACLDGDQAELQRKCKTWIAHTAASLTSSVKECVACDKEGCNGAGSLSFSLPLAILALVASYLYKL